MNNGEIFEKIKGENEWTIYKSRLDFLEKAGCYLEEEFEANESESLLSLFRYIDDDFNKKIKTVYFHDSLSPLLKSILKSY